MPSLRLPDFAAELRGPDPASEPEGAEPETLAAFEDGYKAGWEDAATAQSDAKAARDAEVARTLQSLVLGLEEARTHVLRAVEPLIMQIVGTVLPEMSRVTLAPVVAEVVFPLVSRSASAPIRLRTSPGARDAVEHHLSRITGLSFEVIEEPSFGDGCVQVVAGEVEALIDLGSVTQTVMQTVEAFFQTKQKERQDAG